MRSIEKGVRPDSDYYLYQPSTIALQLYLYPVVLGCFHYLPGYHLKRSSYDSILLMYIEKGSCQIFQGDHILNASENQFILLDCYRPHEYAFPMDSSVYWLHFDGPLARNYYDLITAGSGTVISHGNPYTIVHEMEKLLNLFRNSEPIRESGVSARITRMLTSLLTVRSDVGNISSHTQIIENSLAYINEHFSEPLTLEALAENSNMSPFHFTRVFTAETGFTPHQYLIATRINSAKFLLRTSGISINEVAFSSGFNSESSFCSTFKKWEHTTPGEYRSRAFSEES